MEPENEIDEDLEKIRKKKLENLMKESEQEMKPKLNINTVGKPVILNELNFWEVVQKNARTLIDCYADWCGPCKMLEPIFEKLAVIHQNILFGRINVDFAPKISKQFQIRSIPLMLFFKNAHLVDTLLGAQSYETIEAHIKRFLS